MNFCNYKNKNYNKETKSYTVAFLLSLILTIIPFLSVKIHFFDIKINYFIIIFSALIQIIVHFLYFLHLCDSSNDYWNLMSLLFSLIIIFIIVFGSIWVMYNLNHHVVFS